MAIRTLVVDDSIVFRKVIRDALASFADVQVIDIAKDGEMAVEKICRLQPDLVTLDVEMPGLSGLQVLEELQRRGVKSKVIMVSSLTDRGAEATTRALSLGALDFIVKPCGDDNEQNLQTLRADLRQRLALVRGDASTPAVKSDPSPAAAVRSEHDPHPGLHQTDLIVIGISTGGPKALADFIPKLPADFPIPIVIVQHMPPMFTASMANHLNGLSGLSVVEATDGMAIRPGTVVIAPGGTQFRLTQGSGGLMGRVTDDAPLRGCKPSVDVLLDSVPVTWIPTTLTLIMTGMGDDGTIGSRRIRQHGGHVWAQSRPSCTVYGMPRQVIEQNIAEQTFDLSEMKSLLCGLATATRAGRPALSMTGPGTVLSGASR